MSEGTKTNIIVEQMTDEELSEQCFNLTPFELSDKEKQIFSMGYYRCAKVNKLIKDTL